jgi:hypothetical protein
MMRQEAERLHALVSAGCRGEVEGVGGVPRWAQDDARVRLAALGAEMLDA